MPFRHSKRVDITYELPKLLDRFINGWLGTLNGGSLASAVLAAVATSLFIHIQEQMKSKDDTALKSSVSTVDGDALLVFAYLAVIINCGAAITAFLISSKLVETPFHSAKTHAENPDKVPQEGQTDDGLNKLFFRHLEWRPWVFFKYSWTFSLLFGILCIFAEMLLYLWIVEPSFGVKMIVSISSFLVLTPLLVFSWGIASNLMELVL